jgi:hypothetical protein
VSTVVNQVQAPSDFQREVERRGEEWLANADPSVGVGSRHHTVPAFYLKRFANGSKQLTVRDRSTGAVTTRSYLTMKITDFYTVVGHDGTLDGRLEQLLCQVEGNAARVFGDLLSAFRRPGSLDPVDYWAVVQFLAFQLVRGERKRRELELMADYMAKVQAGQQLTRRDLETLTAVPHPNEHLRMMCKTVETVAPYVGNRPLSVVFLDQPLLITGDEPVIVNVGTDYPQHQPDCFITRKELARRRRAGVKSGGKWSQIVHIYYTRPSGVADAMEIALPLTPKSILFLGPIGADSEPRARLQGAEAEHLASLVNEQVIAQSLSWVAANPAHPHFTSMVFPPASPLLAVCDGGSVMSEQLKNAPDPRRPRLLRDWN